MAIFMTMNKSKQRLLSEYIIDGVRMEATPRQMLENACGRGTDAGLDLSSEQGAAEPIVDETIDPKPELRAFCVENLPQYTEAVSRCSSSTRIVPEYSASLSRGEVARALIEAIWRIGSFKIGDLAIEGHWTWSTDKVGDAAALYHSIEAVCDYADGLGLRLVDYSLDEGPCQFTAHSVLSKDTVGEDIDIEDDTEESFPVDFPYRTQHPQLSSERKCPEQGSSDPGDWYIYIPFDTCNFRLGGSLLSLAMGSEGGTAPEIADPDYFIDCYEVVRELVEDGIVCAGTTVGRGGLMAALDRISGGNATADLGGIVKSYAQKDVVKILFGEIPGVLIQIRDNDYDYIDAELLLQDVAYYPIGRPQRGEKGLRVASSSAVSDILNSLLSSRNACEAED